MRYLQDKTLSKLEDQILERLSDSKYRPINIGALGRKLGVTKKGRAKFQATVEALVSAGKVREGKKGRNWHGHISSGSDVYYIGEGQLSGS